jgi:ElaB/YqjD/DUF883 family membrane-anchored ribosome-binding protein
LNPQDEQNVPNELPPTGLFEQLGRKIDELTEIKVAQAALRETRRDVREVLRRYRRMRRQLRRQARQIEQADLTQLRGAPLGSIRRHPARGLCVAAVVGLLVGWLLPRRAEDDRP